MANQIEVRLAELEKRVAALEAAAGACCAEKPAAQPAEAPAE